MTPLFVFQEIPGFHIPEEMNIYNEKSVRKTIDGKIKLLGVMKAKRSFAHIYNLPLFATWFEAYNGSSIS